VITLCGFSVSNYYNKVKLVLLEKSIPFNEERVMTKSSDEAVLTSSPLGKIPFIRTEHGALCESQVIVDYLEAAYPAVPLLPANPFAAAKVRELTVFIDLHLELVARELYTQAFFGGSVPQEVQDRVRKQLTKNIAAFKRIAKFGPYVAGDTFTIADCAAYVSLPLVALATKKVLGDDLLAAAGIDWKGYAALIGARPHAQKVDADKKADAARMAAAAATAKQG
jgi:glutathione S-transferase